MGQIEDNIKIESDTFALKRDYKYALENVTAVKKELAELIDVKNKVTTEIDSRQEELTKLLNDISQEKLDWASFRHSELQELEVKQSEADNVLKRKSELDKQEDAIKQETLKNTDILNENRRLEIKIKDDKTELIVKEKQLEKDKKELKLEENKILKDKEDFKGKVIEILNKVNEL